MPDLDIIPRTPAAGWHAAKRLIEGQATDAEVAEYVAVDGISISDVRDRLVALYDNYCDEWLQFEDSWAAPPLVGEFGRNGGS